MAATAMAVFAFVFFDGAGYFQDLLQNRETVILPADPANPSVAGRELEIVTILPKDAIQAILNPSFRRPEDTDNYLNDEPVLGISINGDDRVYSVPFLSAREVVNDTVGGVPVAITWCPLCFSGIAYERVIDGTEYTFGVSGKLIKNALVMYDHQTNSLWSQFLARGVKGEFAGRALQTLPLVQTTYARWLAEHPDSLVLSKGRSDSSVDQYSAYYEDNDAGVIGESNEDDRLERKDKVLGLGFDDGPKAFPLADLRIRPVVNDIVAGEALLIYFLPSTETALAYQRTVDGVRLEFETFMGEDGEELLRDVQTGSLWLPFTGMAIEGEMTGTILERVHSVISFWFAWSDFYPETALYRA